MNRPWVIWSLSVLIALLVFGAMGMITQHTLGLEKERARAETKAELEERIRLALWRMDTSAAGILAEENNRPAWHFREVDLRKALPPTPLNLDVPENVKLHFEIHQGVVNTPQVNRWSVPGSEPVSEPGWAARPGIVMQGKELSKVKGADWKSLQFLLNNDDTFRGWQTMRNAVSPLADNNLGMICAVAQRDGLEVVERDPDWGRSIVVAQQQRLNNTKNDIRSAKDYQKNYNIAEKSKRQQIVLKSSGKKGQSINDQIAQKGSVEKSKTLRKPEAKQERGTASGNATENTAGDRVLNTRSPENDKMQGAHFSSLTPVWIGENLILVREVSDGVGRRVQGVWLDAKAIRISLLKDIDDLLPEARLEPVTHSLKVLLGKVSDPDADDPMVMAALPWRLLPGEVAMVEPSGWTAMRKTLAVAWVGALFAALAAVVLLRGVVKLSERRASFVSSVTHELRTPLTTFSLYSDMLAEGMVRDEVKQKEYLYTLRRESARLTHLVENVLAYSQIERGSARAKIENVRVGELVDRICERLRTRADEAGMELHCDVTAEVAEREIKVDTTAVEQIIFNLVDNASKYACGEGCGNVIELRAFEHAKGGAKGVVFQICDEGPGIKRSEQRKLFRAFHKSAQEAAHSKPGVGLGLALCRRLARALGGDLKIVEKEKGACFELTIGKS